MPFLVNFSQSNANKQRIKQQRGKVVRHSIAEVPTSAPEVPRTPRPSPRPSPRVEHRPSAISLPLPIAPESNENKDKMNEVFPESQNLLTRSMTQTCSLTEFRKRLESAPVKSQASSKALIEVYIFYYYDIIVKQIIII